MGIVKLHLQSVSITLLHQIHSDDLMRIVGLVGCHSRHVIRKVFGWVDWKPAAIKKVDPYSKSVIVSGA